MKTIKLILSIMLWIASKALFSQIDPENKTANTPLTAHPITTTFTSKIDSVNHYKVGLRDDTALYYSIGSTSSRGLDSNQRLIYFLHGLGGTPNSWKGSYDGLVNYYQYRPKRPDYYTNQKNFINATYEAHSDMGNLKAEYYRDYFNADSVYKRLPPYVIGHSQGGLVAGELIKELHEDSILDNIFNLIAKDNRDPITKQYGPGDTTYVNDTLANFINPHMPKGLFYGVESDPLIWHLTYFMITKDPGEYGTFGANNDENLAINMEDMRLKLITQAHIDLTKASWEASKWWAPWRNTQANTHLANMSSNMTTADYLAKVNLLYKDVLGVFEDSNYVRSVTKRNCVEKTVIKRKRLFNNTYLHYMTLYRYYSVNPGCSCGPPITYPNYKSGLRWRSKTLSYSYTDVYGDILVETQSDAVVLKPSQMAFPGCPDWYKRPLNEIYDRTTKTFSVVPHTVNHMQMRNCLQTEAALRRLYNGDGSMPEFFKLESK